MAVVLVSAQLDCAVYVTLHVLRNLQGETGIAAALDQADENAKMMPLYDIFDEAGQTELFLKELEYAAQVIVDRLEQSGQLA